MTQKAKGPAALAGAPDHGPTLTPSKDTKMNNSETITHSSETLAPPSAGAMRTTSHCLTLAMLAKLSIGELRDLHEAIRLVENVLIGILNTPKYSKDGNDLVLNAAGDVVDKIDAHLIECVDLIVSAAKAKILTDAADVEVRAWFLLSHEVYFREDLENFAVLAGQQSVAVAEAEAA